jgi:hypothetical protein
MRWRHVLRRPQGLRDRPGRALLALALALGAATSLWLPHPVSAQEGLGVITSPLDGAILNGLVPITGSATHPQFQRYELAFAYSPNMTDTWFSIQPPATSQVINETLGRWDTTQISDGVYVLRLRVFYGENAYLESFVANVRVQNATPTSPPPATEPPPLGPTETPGPAGTVPVIALPPTATPRPTTVLGGGAPGGEAAPPGSPGPINLDMVLQAFLSGIRLTGIAFLILGAYVVLRAALRRVGSR